MVALWSGGGHTVLRGWMISARQGLEGLGSHWGRLDQWQILEEYRLGSHRRFWSEGWGWQSPGTEWIFRGADEPSGWLQPGLGKAPWTCWLHLYWALIFFFELTAKSQGMFGAMRAFDLPYLQPSRDPRIS